MNKSLYRRAYLDPPGRKANILWAIPTLPSLDWLSNICIKRFVWLITRALCWVDVYLHVSHAMCWMLNACSLSRISELFFRFFLLLAAKNVVINVKIENGLRYRSGKIIDIALFYPAMVGSFVRCKPAHPHKYSFIKVAIAWHKSKSHFPKENI